MENTKYNINEMNNLYNNIIENNRLTFEQKKNVLKILLSKIKKYHCYKNGKTTCPYSIILDEEYGEVEFVCDYLNMSGYCGKEDNIERIVTCPINKVENKINEYLNTSHFNELAIPKNQVCVIRTRTDIKGKKKEVSLVKKINYIKK